ncbi:MAG TPA: hypothetical protein PKD61_08630 [Polyangiaceae bacterium]|nr:hypothetical protein [Polyangiaceae bacterium]
MTTAGRVLRGIAGGLLVLFGLLVLIAALYVGFAGVFVSMLALGSMGGPLSAKIGVVLVSALVSLLVLLLAVGSLWAGGRLVYRAFRRWR